MGARRFWFAGLFVLLSTWSAAWRPNERPCVPGQLLVQYRSEELARIELDARPKVSNSSFIPQPSSFDAQRPASLRVLDKKHHLVRSRPVLDAEAQTQLRRKLGISSPKGDNGHSETSPRREALRQLSSMVVLQFENEVEIEAIAAAYRHDPNVIAAEPNWVGTLFAAPTDPLYPQQKLDFSRIGIETAWGVQTGASTVTVAIIDSGVDPRHADLRNVLAPGGYNFVAGNTTISDDLGHGTRVAGIIGAEGNNDEGIAGIAYGVRILPLDVADSSGVITSARAIAAVNYAVVHGADVINMSFGFYARSALFEQTCQNAYTAGVVLVAAAGNENQGTSLVYPAGFDSVIGVAATDSDTGDARAVFTNYNSAGVPLVDLAAPGATIFSTIPGSMYAGTLGSGTSYATPMVAGVAALLRTRYPTQSAAAVRHHLLATAKPVGAWAGSGRLDAAKALTTAMIPSIAIERVIVDDSRTYSAVNDGDGKLDAGERAALRIVLKNTGADAIGLTGGIRESDPEIATPDTSGTWGTLQADSTAGNDADPFTSLTYTSASPTVKRVAFTLTVRANGGAYRKPLGFNLYTENAQTVAAFNHFASQTWTANRTWEVLGTQNFNAGLTIQPGTVVKLAQGAQVNINGGTLIANGTATSPILFTSLYPHDTADAGALRNVGPRTEPVTLSAYPQVRYVSPLGSDVSGVGSAGNPWKTIPYALSQITDAGSTKKYALLVAEGTYGGATVVMKDYVDLYGGFSTAGWTRDIFSHATILDGENARTVVTGANNARLDGFTVRWGAGKGVYCYQASPTLSNNIITGNDGGIGCWNTSATITRNLIADNSASEGGGIYCSGGFPTISGNVIVGNSASYGAGIYCDGSTARISGNIISGNSATYYYGGGGGIYCVNASPAILNNVISANRGYGGGIYCYLSLSSVTNCTIVGNDGAGIACSYSSPTVTSCILYHNSGEQISNSSGAPVVIYCDVEGGYLGAGNISDDPRIAADRLWGIAGQLVYDPASSQTTLVDNWRSSFGSANCLRGRPVRIRRFGSATSRYFAVASNSGNRITVWGDATEGGVVIAPQPYEVAGTSHLSPTSPCVDTGLNAGAPTTDVDGDPRPINGGFSPGADMGADEYNLVNRYPNVWAQLYIKSGCLNSSLKYCTVENGRGVSNESPSSTFSNCTFRSNADSGLVSTSGTGVVGACIADNNQGSGFRAGVRTLSYCIARYNQGDGLVGGALSNCTAQYNISPAGGDGMAGLSAAGCNSSFSGGIGLKISGALTNCTAQFNRGDGIWGDATGCTSCYNGGTGVVGNATGCAVFVNGDGGVWGDGLNSRIVYNTGVGVFDSTSLNGCEIIGNTEEAVFDAHTVNGCRIADNVSGITSAIAVTRCYVAANSTEGIQTTGTVSNSTIVNNQGDGLHDVASVNNSWVMFNRGVGLYAPGDVSRSSIRSNGRYGVQNLVPGKTLNNCNIYGNTDYEYYDDQNDDTVGYPANCKDVRFNYWGAATVAEMKAHPFPSVSIARIYDLFDSLLSNGYYANYGVAAAVQSSSVPNAPDSQPPAFLMSVTPDKSNPVGIGETTVTLTFSKPMNTAVLPAITFGTTVPFTQNVVWPRPVWINSTTARGKLTISAGTGSGLNTLRVSQATDSSGFIIPDDTTRQFIMDSGKLGANNGLAIALAMGSDTFLVEWHWEKGKEPPPGKLRGYHLQRSNTGEPGTFAPNPDQLLTTPAFVDSGLQPSTDYTYMVYWENDLYSSEQMTVPSTSRTLGRFTEPRFYREPPFSPGTSNTLMWGWIADATAYYVEYDDNPGFTSPLNSGWVTGTQWTATGLTDKVTYYYRVKCRNAAMAESGWSNVAPVWDEASMSYRYPRVFSRQDAAPPTTPGAPRDTGDYATTTTVRFSWTAASDTGTSGSGMGSYDLRVGTAPGLNNVFDGNVGNVVARVVTGANGQLLFARVCARDNAGNAGPWSGDSDGILIDTEPPPAPAAPRDTGSFTTSTALRFSWTAARDAGTSGSGVASYDLQVGTKVGGSDVFNANVGAVLTKTITGSAGKIYFARVRARDRAGNVGAWSPTSDGITVDATRPRLVGAAPQNSVTLLITFDEPVVNATVAANYTCTPSLLVRSVAKVNDAQYRLTTTEQTGGISYTLTVKTTGAAPVKDRAGNTLDPAYRSRSFVGRPTAVGAWTFYR